MGLRKDIIPYVEGQITPTYVVYSNSPPTAHDWVPPPTYTVRPNDPIPSGTDVKDASSFIPMGDRKRLHYDSNTNYGPLQKKPYSTQPLSSNECLQNDQGVTSSNSINYQAIANINISEPEWLEKYIKNVLLESMREYKRRAENASELNQQLLEKDEEYKKKLIIVDQLLEYLRKFLIRFDDEGLLDEIGSSDVNFNGPYLNRIYENESLEYTRRVVEIIIEKMTNWFRERDDLLKELKNDSDFQSRLADIYYNEIEKEDNLYSTMLEKIVVHENRSFEVHSLTRDLEIAKANLELTFRNLENTQDKLEQLEKNVDRSNIFTINPFLHLGRKLDKNSGGSANKSMSEKLELIELRSIAESRVKEFNDTQAEKAEWRRKIHEIQEKLRYFPEERIKESETYRTLQLELESLHDSYAHLYALFEIKTREAQILTVSRDKIDDLWKSEMKRMEQEFQEVKKEYHNDLERIRAKRNELVKEVESLRTMIPQEMLANDRMEIIQNLKEEVRKLYSRITEIENSKSRKSTFSSGESSSVRENQSSDSAKKVDEIQAINNQLKFENEESQKNDALYIKELNDRIPQSSEIEMLFSQQKKREDDFHMSVFDTKDQRIEPLKQSLTKFQQKLNEKTEENVKIQNEIVSMNVVVSQQHEQLNTQKNELASTKAQLEKYSKESANALQSLAVYKQKLVSLDNGIKVEQKISEMLRNDRDANVREYNSELRRRDEEKRVMEKKLRQVKDQLETATKEVDELRISAVSSDAQKLLEAYETKWKCSTCNIRFKDHCVFICMHAFCKQCLDKQVESRNRKCAKCGQQFSKTDIRQIFF
ncbi:7410_t:CDS:10 [Diversispora eburnea]|uniref:E3 ubiquitin protein ligase n=1 Tax=Diversispora eburnea TaxID=1213867 RepID=A0A9N8VJP8_9GLOM|nr:7410_t:CDS:10 [Diversispora eburnea]